MFQKQSIIKKCVKFFIWVRMYIDRFPFCFAFYASFVYSLCTLVHLEIRFLIYLFYLLSNNNNNNNINDNNHSNNNILSI